MQLPIKSERDAFRFVLGLGVGCIVAIILAVTVTVPVGLIVLGVVLVLSALYLFLRARSERSHALREASLESAPATTDTWRVLVIANESLSGDVLEREIERHAKAKGPPQLLVVAPVLVSRTRFVTTDVDKAMNQARERLAKTLAWAKEKGLKAQGHIGDPVSPMLAVEDELRSFAPNEILVVTHPEESANWMESGFVEQIRRELDLPVSHVTIDREHGDIKFD